MSAVSVTAEPTTAKRGRSVFVQLRTGAILDVAPRPGEWKDAAGIGETTGVIYTTAADMPSLEDLLEANAVALAVLERPAPTPLALPVTAAALGAISAAGWLLFGGSLSSRIDVNPYTAVSIALCALVLLVTLLVASRAD